MEENFKKELTNFVGTIALMSRLNEQDKFVNKQKLKLKGLEDKIKEMTQNITSKEDFYLQLDKVLEKLNQEDKDKLRAVAIHIFDLGLSKLERLPISIKLESTGKTEYIKITYFDHQSSILYVEGYKDYSFRYYDLEAYLNSESLEQLFTNRQNLQLVKTIQGYKDEQKYYREEHIKIIDKWNKLHSYLNSLLELDCNSSQGCITDDDKLIEEVNKYLEERDYKNYCANQ